MIRRNFLRAIAVTLSILVISSLASAYAASMTMPVTRMTRQTNVATANSIKPVACSAIVLTEIIYCPNAGTECVGNDMNELIIGSAGNDVIQGGKGDDCIIGGGGVDTIRGEQDVDICIGGPETDDFHKSCEIEIE